MEGGGICLRGFVSIACIITHINPWDVNDECAAPAHSPGFADARRELEAPLAKEDRDAEDVSEYNGTFM